MFGNGCNGHKSLQEFHSDSEFFCFDFTMSLVTLQSCRQANDKTSDLIHWPALRLATEDLLQNAPRVFLFNSGQSALLLAKDNRTYALGCNQSGSLGVGSPAPFVIEPTEVIELRGKILVQCAAGDRHVMALTNTGHLYGWGENSSGSVGCGNMEDQFRPVLILQNVTMVSCGPKHTAVVRLNGTVWCWGNNDERQLGLKRNNQIIPVQVLGSLKSQHVVHVDCGKYSGVALTQQNRLYYWGHFGFRDTRIAPPRQVELPYCNFKIVTATAGDSNHEFYFLTTAGLVYRCYHILASPTRLNLLYRHANQDQHRVQCDLIKLNEPVVAMANGGWQVCLKLQSRRVVLLNKSKVIYMHHSSMTDACALYCEQAVTRWIINLLPNTIINNKTQRSMKEFYNPFNHDLKLCLPDTFRAAKRYIWLNKKTTAQCSTYFAIHIKHWERKGLDLVRVETYTFPVYFTLLRYIHTGTVSRLEGWYALDVLQLALESNTGGLRDLCLHFVTNHARYHDLTEWKQWPLIKANLEPNLSLSNASDYLKLAELANEEQMVLAILKSLAPKSLSTARQVLLELQTISGSSEVYSHDESEPLPESYLEWMIRYSDERSMITLLQDPEQDESFSRHLANSLSTENCFRLFQVSVEARCEPLQEQIVRFVASLNEADDLIPLFATEKFRKVKQGLVIDLFTRVSDLRAKSRNVKTTMKRSGNTNCPSVAKRPVTRSMTGSDKRKQFED